MSLESEVKSLTAAILALTAKLEGNAPTVTAPAVAPMGQPVHVAPVISTPAPAAPAMPAPPSFMAPTAPAAPVAAAAPFSDIKGLTDYVISAYQQMGATKGAGIQKVLIGLGYQNINDVRPEHFGQFHAAVEAMKAS